MTPVESPVDEHLRTSFWPIYFYSWYVKSFQYHVNDIFVAASSLLLSFLNTENGWSFEAKLLLMRMVWWGSL
ncbi:hypothetical protein ACSBR2_016387 [Camellia fascicularis]